MEEIYKPCKKKEHYDAQNYLLALLTVFSGNIHATIRLLHNAIATGRYAGNYLL